MKMFQLNLTACITALVCLSSINGFCSFSEFKRIEKNALNHSEIKSLKPQTRNQICISLEGHWSGFCEHPKEKIKESFTIKQTGCSYIDFEQFFEGDTKPLTETLFLDGGIVQQGVSTTKVFFNSAKMAFWNADQTVVTVEGAILSSRPGDSRAVNIRVATQYMLDQGDLLEYIKVLGDIEGDRVIQCRFKKQ